MKLTLKTVFTVVLVAVAIFYNSDAFAQSELRDVTPRVKRGIKLAGGLGYVTADDALRYQVLEEGFGANVEFGFLYEAMVTGNFGLRPEILYSLKGGTIKVEEIGATEINADIMLHYIDIPFLATLHILPHFALHFGPYVGFMIAGDADIDEPSAATPEFARDLDKGDFEHLDGGVAAGLELDYSDMIFGARAYGGFQRLGEKANFLANGRNYTFNVYVGYTW